MARQRRSGPAGEQPEAVVQPGADLLHRQRAQPAGRQLHGQRDAVQPAAELGDPLGGGRGDLEGRQHRPRPVGEQPHRVRQHAGADGADRQRRQRQQVLARGAQRLPAGGQHPQARHRPQQRVGQLGAGLHQVLAAVQHDQQPAPGQLLGQDVQGRPGGAVGQPQCLQHCVAEQQRVLHRGHLHQPGAVREGVGRPGRRAHRQPALAHPARPGHRHQPGGGQQPGQGGQLLLPPDETGHLRGQPAGRRCPPRRRPSRLRCRVAGQPLLPGPGPDPHGPDVARTAPATARPVERGDQPEVTRTARTPDRIAGARRATTRSGNPASAR